MLAALGPLGPLVAFAAIVLAALTASRLLLVLVHFSRVRIVEGWWWLVPIGVQLDVMALAPALFAPALLLLLWPDRGRALLARLAGAWFALVAAVFAFFEAATPAFLAEYDSRPNQIFVEYLRWPREVLPTVWSEQPLAVALGVPAVLVVTVVTWRVMRRVVLDAPRWSWWRRLVALPVVAALLVLGARSSLRPRAANISTAAFSTDHLVNELALDSTYTVAYAIEHERHLPDPGALYGKLPRDEAIARVRRGMLLPDAAFTDDAVPLLHRQVVTAPRTRPYNLVIVLEESLGAEWVGCLGGRPLTPNLDALASEGLTFSNFYATGTRTARGLEAIVAGFPPTPGDAVLERGFAQAGFFTLAELLRRHGYATDFVYGGEATFDNMRSFFLNNGFDRVFDEDTFDAPVFRGTWGVSDEDLMRKADATFAAHGDRPFFGVVLTTTNHPPFEYPPDRVPEAGTRDGAVRYADWAIGEFFRLARQRPYFADTVFLVVADHDTRVFGADLVPIGKFHIPAVALAPGVQAHRYDGLASQVDLGPTLLGLIGLESEHPMMGRDLLALPAGEPGRALMQYDLTNAYRVGDHVVIQHPHKPARQFLYRDGRLVPEALDAELARDALAHVQLAGLLYREQRHRLPARDGSRPRGAGSASPAGG